MTGSVMQVQLKLQRDGSVAVDALRSDAGQHSETVKLPFAGDYQLEAVALALNASGDIRKGWEEDRVLYGALQQLGYTAEQGIVGLRKAVGRQLFECFFPDGGLREALHVTLAPTAEHTGVKRLELRFEAPELGSFPWELLCDVSGRGYLFAGSDAVLVRYVNCQEKAPILRATSALRVLLVTARPKSAANDPVFLPPLVDSEDIAVKNALEAAQTEKRVELISLPLSSSSNSTFRCLSDFLAGVDNQNPETGLHVIHFDTHGGFGKRCERCRVLNDAAATVCAKASCRAVLPPEPQGYIAFEQANGSPDWTSAEELANLLKCCGVRLVVLTGCKSAAIGGKSILSGMAPAIIRSGIPAVAAMQFSISDKAAYDFTYNFYRSIGRFRPLTEAMADLHPLLFHDHPSEWYKPVLYLRTDETNPEGYLFAAAGARNGDADTFRTGLGQETAKAIRGLLRYGDAIPQGQNLRIQLKHTCGQIKLMAAYKHAHDLLQQLDNDFRLVSRAAESPRALSSGATPPWRKAGGNLESMKRTAYRLVQEVTSGPIAEEEKAWVNVISDASSEIEQVTESAATIEALTAYESALIDIEQVLRVRSGQMNKAMLDTMKTLNLASLAGALQGLWLALEPSTIIAQRSEPSDRQGTIENANVAADRHPKLDPNIANAMNTIENFDATADRLRDLLYRHDYWQQFEDELRAWGNGIRDRNQIRRFKIRWETVLRQRVPELQPSANLCKAIPILETALSEGKPGDVANALRTFSDRVLTDFSKVDTNLRLECDNLENCRLQIEQMVEAL